VSEHASAAAPSRSLLGANVRARSRARATDNAWVLALRVVVGSRLLVWIAAFAAIGWFGENVHAFLAWDPGGVTAPFNSVLLDKLLAPVGRWDAVWYIQIAQHGYSSPATTNFFPLYPLLIAIGDRLVDQPLIVGGLISLTCMTAGLALLYRLALLDLDEPAARLTVVLVSLYPMSLFLSAAYTESLFLLLAVGMFYAARRERWALAGLCGGLAAATRSDGVALVLPLALLYLYGPRDATATGQVRAWWRPRYRVTGSAAWLALVPAGLALYLTMLGIAHGDPFQPYQAAQAYWRHTFAGPFGSAVKTALMLPADIHGLLAGTARSVGPGDPLSWNLHDLIDLSFFLGAAGVLATCWRRIPFPYLVYSLVMLAYASSFPAPYTPLQGLPRYLLPVFPLFMAVADRLAGRRWLTRGVLTGSAALLIVFSGLWAIWALVP
jgi:Mannosyltransferase (PIG-V)